MNTHRGFTMVELLVTIAMIAILTAFAVPNFMGWLPNYRLKSAAQDLFAHFQKARITAAKMNTCCTITFNEPHNYMMYIDSNNNLQYDDGEDVLSRVNLNQQYKQSVEIESVNFSENEAGMKSVAFIPSGFPREMGADGGRTTGNGTVALKNTNNRKLNIVISNAGNVRIERGNDDEG